VSPSQRSRHHPAERAADVREKGRFLQQGVLSRGVAAAESSDDAAHPTWSAVPGGAAPHSGGALPQPLLHIRLILRRDRVRIPLWFGIVFLLILMTAASIATAFPSDQARPVFTLFSNANPTCCSSLARFTAPPSAALPPGASAVVTSGSNERTGAARDENHGSGTGGEPHGSTDSGCNSSAWTPAATRNRKKLRNCCSCAETGQTPS
jgi:hypothetical protein